MKLHYDDLYRGLELDIENKKNLINELQNEVNMISVVLQQTQTDKARLE